MSGSSSLIPPAVDFAAAVDILRLCGDPVAVAAQIKLLADKSAEAQRMIDGARVKPDGLMAAKAAHDQTLADMTAKQKDEQQARMAALGKAIADHDTAVAKAKSSLAERERQLNEDRARVAAKERDAEARAAYLTSRLNGTVAA